MIANLLIHAVDVKRPTVTKDAMGGQSKTWTTVYSAVPCFVQPAIATDKTLYAQKEMVVTHAVYTASNPALRPQDVLWFGSRKFVVKAIRDACEMGLVQCIDCEEMP